MNSIDKNFYICYCIFIFEDSNSHELKNQNNKLENCIEHLIFKNLSLFFERMIVLSVVIMF